MRVYGLIAVLALAMSASAEVRFNPLNVKGVGAVVGVTHDELDEAIRTEDTALRNDLVPKTTKINGNPLSGDITLDIPDPYVPDPSDPVFSNAVLSVQLDTNTVAQIGELKAFFDDLPTGTVGTSIGGLLAVLLGAAALLKKRTAHLDNSGFGDNDFATDLLGKQVAISAMKYGLVSTSSTVKAADRTVTKVTLGTTAVTVTFPDADENGKTRDFLLRIDAASLATGGSLTITKPTGATIYGDAFPSPEATKQYLVAITETAANEFYVRTIEITIPTEG